MGCKIKTIQTDNGREFCNDADMSKSLFQIALKKTGDKPQKDKTVLPVAEWSS